MASKNDPFGEHLDNRKKNLSANPSHKDENFSANPSQVVGDDLKKRRRFKLQLHRLPLKMETNEDLKEYSERFKKETNKLKIDVPNKEEEITLTFLASLAAAIPGKAIQSLIDNTPKELTVAEAVEALTLTD